MTLVEPTVIDGVGTVQTPLVVIDATLAHVASVGTVQTHVGIAVAFPADVAGVGAVQTPIILSEVTGTASGIFGGLTGTASGSSAASPALPATIVIPPRAPGDIELIASCGAFDDYDGGLNARFEEASDGNLLCLARLPYSTVETVTLAERVGDEFTFDLTDIESGTGPVDSPGRQVCGMPDGRVLAWDGSEIGTIELDAGVAEWTSLVPQDFQGDLMPWRTAVVAMDDTHAVIVKHDSALLPDTPCLELIKTEPGLDPDTSFDNAPIGALPMAGGMKTDDQPIIIKVGPTRVFVAWTDWTTDIYNESYAAKRNRVLYCQLVDVDLDTGAFALVTGVERFVCGLPAVLYGSTTIRALWYPSPSGDGGVCVLISNQETWAPPEIVARSLVITGDTITEGHSGLRIAEPGIVGGNVADDFRLSHFYEFAALKAGNRGVVFWPNVAAAGVDIDNFEFTTGVPINYTKFLVDLYPPTMGGLRVYETDELIPPDDGGETFMEIGWAGPSVALTSGEMVATFNQAVYDGAPATYYDRVAYWFVIGKESP